MSSKNDHQKLKEAMIALAVNDTQCLPCLGRLDCPSSFSCPNHVCDSFYKPVTDQLLNYTSYESIGAVQLMQDRKNSFCLCEMVRAGLSQVSHLPDEDEKNYRGYDWNHTMEEFSDTDDY
jgi:hypothetical protein